MEIENNEIPY